mgnify:CR=1 FL=1
MQLHTLIPFLIRNNMCVGAAFNKVRQSTTRRVGCGIDTAAIYLGFAAKTAPIPNKLL